MKWAKKLQVWKEWGQKMVKFQELAVAASHQFSDGSFVLRQLVVWSRPEILTTESQNLLGPSFLLLEVFWLLFPWGIVVAIKNWKTLSKHLQRFNYFYFGRWKRLIFYAIFPFLRVFSSFRPSIWVLLFFLPFFCLFLRGFDPRSLGAVANKVARLPTIPRRPTIWVLLWWE